MMFAAVDRLQDGQPDQNGAAPATVAFQLVQIFQQQVLACRQPLGDHPLALECGAINRPECHYGFSPRGLGLGARITGRLSSMALLPHSPRSGPATTPWREMHCAREQAADLSQ